MQQTAALDPQEWEGLPSAWDRFATENQHLGLGQSRFTAGRFARRFYREMARQGVMRRTNGGRYICHRTRFPTAAFNALIAAQEGGKA
jgi:hypothetical protein